MAHDAGLSYEKRLEIYNVKQQHPEWGARKVAEHVGDISKDTAHKYMSNLPAPSSESPSATETNDIKGDSWTISLPKTRICTLEELIEHCKIDLDKWEVERFVANKWEMGYKNKAEDADVIPLFQIKAFLKKRIWVEDAEKILERLRIKAEKHAPKYPAIKVTPSKSGNIVEISPVDVHFGGLSWAKETGFSDWDLSISERTYKDAVLSLMGRTEDYKPEGAAMILGHDQQNADNRAGMTEAGTPQNNDGRYQKVAEVSENCSIWAIDACLMRYGKVDVFMVPGNHDYLSTWHLGRVLSAWYRNCPKVTIHNSPNPRKYWEYGVNMLLFTHGNKGKLERYPGVMASEQPEMWGRTKWHEAHTGDKHQRRLLELDGATVRILPSLRPPCSWTAENMFLGSVRAAEAYVWNKDEGLVGTACYSVLRK